MSVSKGSRPVHDLAALEAGVWASGDFPDFLLATLVADARRGGETTERLTPTERLAAMLAILQSDTLYPAEYARFVEGMAFAGAGEVPPFEAAMDAVTRLCALLPE